VDDSEKAMDIVETAQKHFPHLKIISRSKNWMDYYDMLDKNVYKVYREFFDTGLRMGADALQNLGYRNYQVQRALKKFRRHDESFTKELAKSRYERKLFLRHGRQVIEEIEKMMLEDIENEARDKDLGWDIESIKEEFGPLIRKLKE